MKRQKYEKITPESFSILAKNVHGDKYSYETSKFIKSSIKVEVYCNTCKNFILVWPLDHIFRSAECWVCSYQTRGNKTRKPLNIFIKESLDIYGDIFDFSKSIYKNATTKIEIIHKVCGKSFLRNPNNHINAPRGCPHCSKNKKLTTDIVLERLYKKYNDRYIFPDFVYKNRRSKIKIICSHCSHTFYRKVLSLFDVENHCPKCTEKVHDTETFINECVNLFGDKFDYSKSVYVNCKKPILIKCNECNQWFLKNSTCHIKSGLCPYHKMSKGELKIKKFFDMFDIHYTPQFKIPECKHIISLPFDFAIHDINNNIITLLEFQGVQHYRPVNFGGMSNEVAEENFKLAQIRDNIKRKYCEDNNIPLLEIHYKDIDKVDLLIIKHLKTLGVDFRF